MPAGMCRPDEHRHHKEKCVFCRICAGCEPARVAYQNERVVVFWDHRPAAKLHLLVVPRAHIKNINHLTADDLQLVREMHEVGARVLQELAPDSPHKMGYHIPPFTSVDHLHCHLFALPHVSCMRFKYTLPSVWQPAKAQEEVLEKQLETASCVSSADVEHTHLGHHDWETGSSGQAAGMEVDSEWPSGSQQAASATTLAEVAGASDLEVRVSAGGHPSKQQEQRAGLDDMHVGTLGEIGERVAATEQIVTEKVGLQGVLEMCWTRIRQSVPGN